MKILLAGGGSGGHTFPLIAVARKLQEEAKKQGQSVEISFIGVRKGSEEIWEEKGIEAHAIVTGKIRRYFSLGSLLDFPMIMIGFLQSYFFLLLSLPDVIFSKGGYGSFPTVVLGWIFRIPIILHESDSITGLTNKQLSRFATHIILSFPQEKTGLKKEKEVVLGNPVRDISGGSIESAKKTFQITSDKPVILIMGGSQGSEQINKLIVKGAVKLSEKYEIIHQTGEKNFQKIKRGLSKMPAVNKKSFHYYPFLKEQEMKDAYAVTSLIISRSGSGAIFEAALVGKPSILIPLATSAGGHQERNAIIYESYGACVIVDSKNIEGDILMDQIDMLMEDKKKLKSMGEAARKFAKPNAASYIAKLILKT